MMAIETTYFTGATAAANYAEVSAWLTVNAAEYFDTIDVSSGAQEVNCKVGDVTALKLDWSAEFATQRAFKITAKNGVVIDNGYFFNFDRCVWRRGVKTSNGIMLCNGSTDSFQTSLLVARNSEGGIIFALVSPDNTNINNSVNRGRLLDFEKSLKVSLTTSSSNSNPGERHNGIGIFQAGRTALVPIVSDAGTYSNNVFYVPFSQFIDSCFCKIDVDGTKYVYNGVFALKE
jgi:hypothetical protein